MTMAAQFQSVPALAPWLMEAGGLSFVSLGALTGAYLLPGAVIALLGGWLGQTVGDARVAFAGLIMMAIGGCAIWVVGSFEAMLAWRTVSGVGAVGLNVMLTKMAADWFDGREDLPSAMGVLVSSWPAGIALAALVLPFVAAQAGLNVALLLPAILCAMGFLAMALVWRAPEARGETEAIVSAWFTRKELVLVLTAGLIWSLYNVALIGTIAWTPGLLEGQGIGSVRALAVTSLIGWVAIFSVAAGGWMAANVKNRDLPALSCFIVSAAIIGALPFIGSAAGSGWVMGTLGFAIGPAAAMVMTLPVEAARPPVRALAMGLYFALYYAFMGLGPVFFGGIRDAVGHPSAPLGAAALMLLICVALWFLFRRMQHSMV